MPDPHPPCSVGLEGGVTSAVIYASLLARLARHDSFWQLGGASSDAAGTALTTCLHGFFPELAGPPARGPLTFGELWWALSRMDQHAPKALPDLHLSPPW